MYLARIYIFYQIEPLIVKWNLLFAYNRFRFNRHNNDTGQEGRYFVQRLVYRVGSLIVRGSYLFRTFNLEEVHMTQLYEPRPDLSNEVGWLGGFSPFKNQRSWIPQLIQRHYLRKQQARLPAGERRPVWPPELQIPHIVTREPLGKGFAREGHQTVLIKILGRQERGTSPKDVWKSLWGLV